MPDAPAIREETDIGRLCLRLGQPAEVRPSLFELGMSINQFARNPAGICARLGPDEWLLMMPESQLESARDQLTQVLAGSHHSLVEISDRQRAFSVAGPHAAEVMNAGCPLDLHLQVFPPGAATRTVLGPVPITLLRLGPDTFHVECDRSLAPYVRGLLEDAALEYTSTSGR